uniref:Uncharacterized protein n=1 Tax=Peronospora matthiolae TaxID=2874970 RepID=A0AAV1TW90_9STRA
MVRVPGSSGDSAFHRESRDEDVKIKTEPGIGVSAEFGSPQTREEKGSQDHHSFGRGYDDNKVKEEDHQADLEEKPQPPPEVPSGTTADRAAKHDLPYGNPSVKTERSSSKTTAQPKARKHTPKLARSKTKTAEPHRNKQEIKAEGQDVESEGWQLERITWEFHWQQLKKLLAEDPVLKVLKPKLIG